MIKQILKYCTAFSILFIILTVVVFFLFKFFNPPFSAFMQINSGAKLLSIDPWEGYEYEWVNLDKISPNFLLAVIASEDQKFPLHHGFDFDQITKAVDEKKRGIRLRGASTITQQTVKNIFLWGGKDYLRKAFEAYYTVAAELIWGKSRIIEIYANVAELGENIYGIESASSYYFNKPSTSLSQSEAAMLAAILPNPLRFAPNNPSDYLIKRRNEILKQMENLGELIGVHLIYSIY